MPRQIAKTLSGSHPITLFLRQLPALALGGLLVFVCSERLAEIDFSNLGQSVLNLSVWQWTVATGLAGLSFWAVGQYDALIHRHLATGRSGPEAQRAGLVAIAIGQAVGLGVLIGALVRHRMLPGLGFGQALKLTLTVSALFLAGWAFVTALVFALFPTSPPLRLVAIAVLAIAPILAWASLMTPTITIFGRSLRLPTLSNMAYLVGFAALDTIAAGLCLMALLPPEAGITIAQLMPAFLLALGVGMITGTPGGIGAFEVIMLSFMPQSAAEPLLAAILAWRAIYFILPAAIAFVFLGIGPGHATRARTAPKPMLTGLPLPSWIERLLYQAPRAEAGILRQGDKSFLPINGGGLIIARTGQALVMLGDGLGNIGAAKALKTLKTVAKHEARLPCLYKISAKQAIAARKAGWKVAPVAHEGWLRPAGFDPDTPKYRQLRRKLRKAKSAGVVIHRADRILPIKEMATISEKWTKARGGERGLSMGRFCPSYVRSQKVYLAYQNERLIGFLTLHVSNQERTVDLMRSLPDTPDGTMHALLYTALTDAADAGCPRLSLAAVPHENLRAFTKRLPHWLCPEMGDGLSQFKNAFAPNWETLYIAAPSWPALVISGYDLARAIANPVALAPPEVLPNAQVTLLRPVYTA